MVCLTLASPSLAQVYSSGDGTGARFGTRDPYSCPNRREPEQGPISARQATIYVICGPHGDNPKSVGDNEARSGTTLELYDNVQIQAVGRPRAATADDAFYGRDLDPSEPVYPIQGSFADYTCDGSASAVKGRNCLLYYNRVGRGVCYKDSFSNWNCSLVAGESGHPQPNVAGPGFSAAQNSPSSSSQTSRCPSPDVLEAMRKSPVLLTPQQALTLIECGG